MSSHAKAQSPGTDQRQATGLRRILRGIGATRASSLGGDGRSAPSWPVLAGALVSLLALASAAPAAAACPNEQFRTGPSAQLPDCRAYEQATPVDKNGGGAEGTQGLIRAATDGSAVTFYSQAGLPGGVGAQEFPTFMASRGASSWSSSGLLPPQAYGEKAKILGYSPDLRYVVTKVINQGMVTLLIEDTEDHQIETVVPFAEAAVEKAFILVAVSNDGSRVFFEAKIPLGTSVPSNRQQLFVWERSTGTVTLVGVPPEGEPSFSGSFAGPYRWYGENETQGGAFDSLYVAENHAISESGDRAYFTARSTGHLYLRSDPAGPAPSTVEVSASQKTNGSGEEGHDPNGPQPAAFLMATPDGGRAFFMSREELTNDAYTGSEDQAADLYEYDAETGDLTDLTASASNETPNGAEVQGVLGMSESGSILYFVANGVLATGTSPGTCTLEAGGGECNLYRYDSSGGVPSITFVARLEGYRLPFFPSGDARNWSPASAAGDASLEATSRVTPDGETVLFSTYRSLTGYDNLSSGCPEGDGSEGRCAEYYRYSAGSEQIVCVSCDPSGSAPEGQPGLRPYKVDTFAGTGIRDVSPFKTRNLSADGTRVFFETPDALVSGDVNGEDGCKLVFAGQPALRSCQDVYEWEQVGVGSCVHATMAGGCLYLVSTGQSGISSNIADIDETGENVFFFTGSPLVPADRDQLRDVYDARVVGGLASQHETPPAQCAGEGCHGDSPTAPQTSEPGSSTFSGPGNAHPKPAPKRKRHRHKRHGRHKKHKSKQRRKARTCNKQERHCKSHRTARRNARGDRGGAR